MDNGRILIAGTGAIGSFYGGKLYQSGAEVSVLCRSDYDKVKEDGIQIKSVLGDFHFTPHKVINKIEDYASPPDYILLTTKVVPGVDIKKLIGAKVGKNTSIVLIQNGIDTEKPVKELFPENEIISGLAFICVARESHGIINHQDYGQLTIGTYPDGISNKVIGLQNMFNKGGIQCLTDDNIVKSRWKKLVWNAPFNPISVIGGGVDTSTILNNDNSYKLVTKVMEEVMSAAKASGYELPEDTISKNIHSTLIMKPYKTSMLLDFENKRPMEVDVILGNTLKIAHELNLSVPNLEALYSLLSLINENNLKRK